MAEGASHKLAGDPRPLSPHLQIWGWTVTMASSITHRATGVALYSGAMLLALWVFALALGEEKFSPLGGFVASPIGIVILAGYVWALMFHLLNGIRHLYWDSGRGLKYETARMTAWFIYITSFILAAIIVWAALSARGTL